jgi:CRISPR-associated protein Cas5t
MNWNWYKVEVPIASFAVPFSRELPESYPFPPPATVYGMLLSFIGETNRLRYRGTRIIVGVTSLPEVSWVLRKTRRYKTANISDKENSKPDQVSLLTSLQFVAGVRDSKRPGIPSLNGQVLGTLRNPRQTVRFGGLSCGESHNLINSIDLMDEERLADYDDIWWLMSADEGEWTVSLWVDHVGSDGSVWAGAQFMPDTWERVSSLLDERSFVIDPEGQHARI